jgi:ferric iron reductase protein FhuF
MLQPVVVSLGHDGGCPPQVKQEAFHLRAKGSNVWVCVGFKRCMSTSQVSRSHLSDRMAVSLFQSALQPALQALQRTLTNSTSVGVRLVPSWLASL